MATLPITAERLIEVFDSDPRSDSEIASGFHVSKQSISAWRKGDRSPKLPHLSEIAKYYNKDVLWFFGFDNEKNDLPIPEETDEQIAEIISLLRGMSDRKKAEAIRYLRYLSDSEEVE